jgi:hypothetical protein
MVPISVIILVSSTEQHFTIYFSGTNKGEASPVRGPLLLEGFSERGLL